MAPKPNSEDDDKATTATYIKATSEMMQQIALSMSMGNALQGVRPYDGANMPVRDFIQDLRNGAKSVPKTVLTKLKGQARECTVGKQFATLEELIKLLKKRFTPGRDYAY